MRRVDGFADGSPIGPLQECELYLSRRIFLKQYSEPKAHTITLNQDPSFSILVKALEATGLAASLGSCRFGPVTIFAPQDEAFEALAASLGITIRELLKLSNLETILLNHVVAGEVLSEDFVDGLVLESLAGFDLTLTGNRKGFFISSTGELIPIPGGDGVACNGIAHVLDGVLLPPTPKPARG